MVCMRKVTKNGKGKRASGRGLNTKQKRELAAAFPEEQIGTSDILGR